MELLFSTAYATDCMCRVCNMGFSGLATRTRGGKELKAAVCENCDGSQIKKPSWLSICPPEYANTDPNRIADTLAKVWNASQLREKRGCGVIGHSRKGKTRSVLLALCQRFESQGTIPQIVNHVRFGETATRASNGEGSQRQEAKELLYRWRTCKCLFIDDLGKAADTERASEALYMLIEHRGTHQLQTWWTSEHGSADLRTKLGDKGNAIVNRLAEFTNIVTV